MASTPQPNLTRAELIQKIRDLKNEVFHRTPIVMNLAGPTAGPGKPAILTDWRYGYAVQELGKLERDLLVEDGECHWNKKE